MYSFQFVCHGKIPVHLPSKYVKQFSTNGHLGTNRSNSLHFPEKNVMFDTLLLILEQEKLFSEGRYIPSN